VSEDIEASMTGRPRVRRRTRMPIAAGVVAVLALPAVFAATTDPWQPGLGTPADAAGGREPVVPAAPAEDRPQAAAAPADATAADDGAPAERLLAPFARIGDVTLRIPNDQVLLVGFHEASVTAALDLEPVGTLRRNHNRTRIDPPVDDPAGAEYVVMSSRGRSPGPTSAVDLAMRDDDAVLSPVDGVVTDVRKYWLYGRHADHRIEIQPDSDPRRRIVMIHVRDVEVAEGDRVAASATVLAGGPNRFAFGSQIDRYLEPARWPHVHIEVKNAKGLERPDRG
jgi:hypothetical protein